MIRPACVWTTYKKIVFGQVVVEVSDLNLGHWRLTELHQHLLPTLEDWLSTARLLGPRNGHGLRDPLVGLVLESSHFLRLGACLHRHRIYRGPNH